MGGDRKTTSGKADTLRRYLILWTLVLASAGLLFRVGMTSAQEEDKQDHRMVIPLASSVSEETDSVNGYPVRKRLIGGPTDVEWDLDNSFPKRGSVWEMVLKWVNRRQKYMP